MPADDGFNAILQAIRPIAPFIRRAGIVVTGREKLSRMADKLEFVLITADASENTVTEITRGVGCPQYRALTSQHLAELFGLMNCRVAGFRKSSLAVQARHALSQYRISRHQPSDGKASPPWPMPPRHPRVAVLGASGIGRHHARWWKVDGANVIAFLGSTASSLQHTADVLHQYLGGQQPPRGYTDLEKLLETEHPDIVDICLPPEMHYQAARAALAHGVHTIIEKPFLFDATLSPEALLVQADELVGLAASQHRMLGMTSQYFGQTRYCRGLRENPEKPVECLKMELFTVQRHHSADPRDTWIDLGPHLLAAAQGVSDGRIPDAGSLQAAVDGACTRVSFDCVGNDLPPLHCELACGRLPNAPDATNHRLLELDGCRIDCQGCRDHEGNFQMNLRRLHTTDSHFHADFMRTLLKSFGNGRIVIDGATAKINLEWLLRIAELIPKEGSHE